MDAVEDLLAFLDASVTPWHAVEETTRRLTEAGYRELDPRGQWELSAGDRVYVVRGGSSVAAFEIGTAPISSAGLRLVGAHTDSPNLRLKPNATTKSEGMGQLAVEPYGGVLLHTWLDRDLGVAGRVWVKRGEELVPRLVRVGEPIARVPSLAIHLHKKVNSEGLKLNKQKHLSPLICLREELELDALLGVEGPLFGFDLCLYDVTPPALGGADGDLIFSARLDNLASCHAGLRALLDAGDATRSTRGIVLYDHEEVGSSSAQGADSPFLAEAIERIVRATDDSVDARPRALAASMFVSADMAHAVHPNYADKHEPDHMPKLGAGPVIKVNSNQRYATDGEMLARFTEWCEAADVRPQRFVTRSDLSCGSTIGPISASRLGIRTVDVGNPMLSMHSCREMAGAADVAPMIATLGRFFSEDR